LLILDTCFAPAEERMRARLQRLGLFGDILASGVLAGIGSLVNVAGVFLFARGLDPVTFGLFSTCRRFVAFLAPLPNLNGHLAVSRYLGYHASEPAPRSAIFAIGLTLLALVGPATLGIFFLLQHVAGGVEWIGALDRSVWNATAFLTAATAGGLVVFSMLRGLGHPQAANLHQLVFLTAMLGIGAAARGRAVETLLVLSAAAATLTSLTYLAWLAAAHRREWLAPGIEPLRRAASDVLRYSLPRLADGPCQASLPLIGVMLAPGIGGLALAGHMHIGQTLVRMMEVFIVPLSVLLLPIAARQVRDGQTEALRRQAQLIYDSVLVIGVHLALQSMVWSPALLHVCFGDKYAGANALMLVTLPAIVPYLLYAGFRSFVDGYSVRPVNFLHLLAASLVVLGLSVPLGRAFGGVGLALGYTGGTVLLGALTLRYARRHFRVRAGTSHAAWGIAMAAGAALASWACDRACAGLGRLGVLAAFAVVQLGLAAGLAAGLQRLGHPTIVYALTRLRSAGPAAATADATHGADAVAADATCPCTATTAAPRRDTPVESGAPR
jgi:O-antigen/teichoic acid export membrane protein